MQEATRAFQRGDYFEASNIYSTLLQDAPHSTELLMKRGDAYKEMQSFKRAILDYSAVIEKEPHNLEALAKRALCYSESEKYRLALQDIEFVISISKAKGIRSRWTQMVTSIRDQTRKLAVRQAHTPQEEFDEYYLTLYRIHLDGSLPSNMLLDEFVPLHVVISNEFWLFRAKDLLPYYPVELEFSIVEIDESSGAWREDRFTVDVHENDKAIIPREGKECQARIAVRLRPEHASEAPEGRVLASKGWHNSLFLKITAKGEATAKHIVGVLCLIPGTLQNDSDKLAPMCTFRWMPVKSTHLVIRELPDAIGTKIWDCAIFLTRYLEDRSRIFPNFMRGKRVLEIGSGTGLVGLTCRVLGAQVTMTELDEVLPNLIANMRINSHICSAPDDLQATMLEWGKEPDANTTLLRPPYEMIVASDIIYETIVIEDLVKSMVAMSDSHTTVLLAYRCRGLSEEREAVVFAEFEKYFEIQPAPGVNPAILYNAKIFSMTRKP